MMSCCCVLYDTYQLCLGKQLLSVGFLRGNVQPGGVVIGRKISLQEAQIMGVTFLDVEHVQHTRVTGVARRQLLLGLCFVGRGGGGWVGGWVSLGRGERGGWNDLLAAGC